MAETTSPEAANGAERAETKEQGKFNEIQGKLRAIASLPPDPSRSAEEEKQVEELKAERFHLIEDAETAGLFNGIKSEVALIEMHYSDIDSATSAIRNINVKEFEVEAKAAPGKWNPDFKGMLEEYRDLSALVLDRARLKVDGAVDSSDYKLTDRQIRIGGWSGVPSAMADQLARKHYETERSAYVQAKAIAEAQGVLSPQQTLEDFREGEEYLKPTTAIVPGSEPRFWLILTEDEKWEWYARSTLMIAGYKKSLAKGTDELYMDAMREVGVDLNKTAMKRIFRKPGVLASVGIYMEAIGGKDFLKYKDKKDLSLKDVFCNTTSEAGVIASMKEDFGDDIFTRKFVFDKVEYKSLGDLGKKLHDECADSFYPHSKSWGTPIEEASFRSIKRSIRFWLITKGRDLLLTNEELKNRKEFYTKPNALQVLIDRARDAEQIAWNFTYVTDVLETFDSREFRPKGTRRHPPSGYWTLFQWIPMHPQERFEQKIARGATKRVEITSKDKDKKFVEVISGKTVIGKLDVGEEYKLVDSGNFGGKKWTEIEFSRKEDNKLVRGWIHAENSKPVPEIEPKEDWSAFGTWGIRNLTSGAFRDAHGNFDMPEDLKVLPDTLIRGPLFTQEHKAGQGEAESLYTILDGIGKTVLHDVGNAKNSELFDRIDWSGMNDAPFVPFIFDEMRWADAAVNVFKKGGERESKVSGSLLSESVYNLGLTRKQRDRLLLVYLYGVDPNYPTLKPKANPISYAGKRDEFLHNFPNYYYELHTGRKVT